MLQEDEFTEVVSPDKLTIADTNDEHDNRPAALSFRLCDLQTDVYRYYGMHYDFL